ncbi:MAG TPA: hypothetical protein DDW76_28330 [Cyanobacteria bacterium UBA11369]|nr:hypothetical protein [Cyanobacteria bacterium UBA11371]HBE36147.1 hypothetical protein [Cyanobacteria bacterium UBA11368]HBE52569.1 hypothetical protein [Cyanobacteria bacterium UBA11369]
MGFSDSAALATVRSVGTNSTRCCFWADRFISIVSAQKQYLNGLHTRFQKFALALESILIKSIAPVGTNLSL